MAAVTPSSVYKESAGSMTLHIATFANTTDNSDTWASAIEHIVGYWINATDDPTSTASCGCSLAESSGTFTIGLGEANRSVMVYVLSKS